MKNEIDFKDEWTLLKIDGGRNIHRDDIKSIRLSDSGVVFLVEYKREKGLFPYLFEKCHFIRQ